MARRLLLLATLAAAGMALAACDNPAANVLASAQPGQCYKVTGKNNSGQPKLVHADCGTPGAVSQPAVPTASTGVACVAPTQPAVPPPCAGASSSAGVGRATGLTYHTAQKRSFWRRPARVVRKAVRHRTHVRQTYVHDEYVPKGGEVYSSQQHYEYARPSETTELAGGHSSHHQQTYSAPPPPPPPPVVHRDERRYESRDYQSRAYSSESYASSSRYASSSQGRRKPCNCSRDRRPVIIEEYERDGYLTWPGKRGY